MIGSEKDIKTIMGACEKYKDMCRNLNVLSAYLNASGIYKGEEEMQLGYCIYLNALMRCSDYEQVVDFQFDRPVFGKELDMIDKKFIIGFLIENFSDTACYIVDPDYTPKETDICVNKYLNLYKTSL